jgi:putative YphP/YqiW family bacilliredoxin
MYDPVMVKPMREEVTCVGVKELLTPEEVDQVVNPKVKSTLVFVNSVCGCAAGMARPGLIQALKHKTKPEVVATVFAGMEKAAVSQARSHMVGYPPSSPSFAIFREGEIVHMIHRHDIEGQTAEDLAQILTSAFDKYCGETIREDLSIYDPKRGSEISVEEAARDLKAGKVKLVDVRTPQEALIAKIQGSFLISEELVEEIENKWSRDTEIVVYCHHGVRSLQGVAFFKQMGFTKVKSMAGGIDAWSNKIDPQVPRY